MAIYWPIPGFKGRTFKLCVLTRWDFNFCVRSSPLQVRPTERQRQREKTDRQTVRDRDSNSDERVTVWVCICVSVCSSFCETRVCCRFQYRSSCSIANRDNTSQGRWKKEERKNGCRRSNAKLDHNSTMKPWNPFYVSPFCPCLLDWCKGINANVALSELMLSTLRETERQKQTDRQRHRERQRQTDRKRDKVRDRETDRDRETNRQVERERDRENENSITLVSVCPFVCLSICSLFYFHIIPSLSNYLPLPLPSFPPLRLTFPLFFPCRHGPNKQKMGGGGEEISTEAPTSIILIMEVGVQTLVGHLLDFLQVAISHKLQKMPQVGLKHKDTEPWTNESISPFPWSSVMRIACAQTPGDPTGSLHTHKKKKKDSKKNTYIDEHGENKKTTVIPRSPQVPLSSTTVLFHSNFSHGKCWSLSPWKTSCNRVALQNLRCMGVLAFP